MNEPGGDLLTSVREILETTPERWRALARTVEPGLLAREAAPGQWSALECLAHIVDTEEAAFLVRVRAFLEGRDFEDFDPDAAGSEPAPSSDSVALAERFAALRAEGLAMLDSLGPPDLDRTARHSELGTVTLREMLNEWAAHDLNHTIQAERALMQPFIVGSGKWRGYFADHDAGRQGGQTAR